MAAVASFWDTNMAAVTSCERGVLEEIERFHSRGQHLCKFIGTKETFTLEKSSTPKGFFWYTNMAAVSLFWTPIWSLRRYVKTLYNESREPITY